MPAASTLLGLSALPSDDPRNVGMLGMHGNYGPNIKNKECDLLVAVGMRFDDRVTGDPAAFGPNARIIHLEIDPSEIDKIVHADVPLVGDVKRTLPLHDRTHPPARPQRMDRRSSAPATASSTSVWCGGRSVPTEGASAWARRSTPWHAPTTATR